MKKFLSSLLFVFATMCALPAFATLPTGYTELEYVVFNGASYIDTGIVIKDPRNIEQTFWVQFDAGTIGSFQSLFGFMGNNAFPRYAVNIYSGYWMLGVNTTAYNGTAPKTRPYQLKFVTTGNTQTLYDTGDDTVLETASMTDFTGFADNNLTSFFGARNADSRNYVYGKMGASYMKQNGVLVYNYIPAQYNNTVGFYDTVSNTFKTATVGTFTAGPVVGIKIATTAYNDAQFAPVEAALESAVTTIKDVVANTIVQADAIQNLQDTKQTMPDANGTNGTCPRFRQCLLVETEDGAPQWFVINDPFRDFVTPILANNSTIPAVNEQRRYAGDLELCRMLPQTDDEATNTGITKCTTVANYQNYAAANPVKGGALKPTEWGYEFKAANLADNPNNDGGIVYGISKCVSTEIPAGQYAKPATSTQLNNALWDARPTTMAEADKYRSCWCKTTGIAYGGQYYETSAAPWVFSSTPGSAAVCAYNCAFYCAHDVRGDADFRKGIMGWAVE